MSPPTPLLWDGVENGVWLTVQVGVRRDVSYRLPVSVGLRGWGVATQQGSRDEEDRGRTRMTGQAHQTGTYRREGGEKIQGVGRQCFQDRTGTPDRIQS